MSPQDPEPPDRQLDAPTTAETEALELFRRSPHPYHRRQKIESPSFSLHRPPSSPSLLPSSRTTSDADGRKRRKVSPSPSESGTEADDEGYGFVKALPAPPLRPRKGLRDVLGNGGATPLLTPSQVDEEGRRCAVGYFKVRKDGGVLSTDDEARVARQKYLRRRRNELVRRTTETVLLGGMGVLAVRGCGCWEELLQWHRVELLMHALVMAGVLCLYPLRLLQYSASREPPSSLRFRQRIRIPAAFDPAPILYPAILPVLISISLFSTFQKPLLPNILLGLAALPPQLIPYGTSPLGYSAVHWMISILPLIASENTELPSKLFPLIPHKLELSPPDKGLDPEILASLFALHQALLPPLHYLTTTSLLPTELHILSIGLINLFLFSDSPQMEILQTVLWLGGVGLFVLCGKVLKWGVALARIPRWRFRRAGQAIKNRQSFLQVLNDSLKPSRSHSAGGKVISDSDADEDDWSVKNPLKKTKSLRLNMTDSVMDSSHTANGNEVRSAVEPKKSELYGNKDERADSITSLPARRNTLPSLDTLNQTHPSTRRRSKSIAQSFLSLTSTQATIRKWIYAAYFYIVVVIMILGPVRYLIGTHALRGHEPFGWALGYLLGNIQPLRFQVLNYDLDTWIALPPLPDPSPNPSPPVPLAEHLRQSVLGPANTRLLLCAYCFTILTLGLITVLRLTSSIEVDTRRKVFHGMMVAMLLPTIYIDPCFVALALALVLAVFLLLDLIRASQLPPLSRPLASFLTPYVDGRDLRGPVVVSHIFLLIGCAIPLWLSLAGVPRGGDEPWVGWEVHSQDRDVSMVAGVVCVGMGDAAASLFGRRFGRRKWPWAGGKSLEGSLAFAVAVTLGLVFGKLWLAAGWGAASASASASGDVFVRGRSVVQSVGAALLLLGKAVVCAAGASLNEAVLTGGNDNVVVPVVLWVLVRGVGL
ncbi:hypothetical protein BDV95DRAFT_602299 [Massariosphaeria phaeospora]|uniref:dolichol kinase n=1 Tax=Massariosphaeria phaeospora TaxID=100035 RepID=A0A7C8MEB0_9PLEO|nr:hypothetical protein BDV95DRAFT_602299 [Massariosphaeria phaeospora]